MHWSSASPAGRDEYNSGELWPNSCKFDELTELNLVLETEGVIPNISWMGFQVSRSLHCLMCWMVWRHRRSMVERKRSLKVLANLNWIQWIMLMAINFQYIFFIHQGMSKRVEFNFLCKRGNNYSDNLKKKQSECWYIMLK